MTKGGTWRAAENLSIRPPQIFSELWFVSQLSSQPKCHGTTHETRHETRHGTTHETRHDHVWFYGSMSHVCDLWTSVCDWLVCGDIIHRQREPESLQRFTLIVFVLLWRKTCWSVDFMWTGCSLYRQTGPGSELCVFVLSRHLQLCGDPDDEQIILISFITLIFNSIFIQTRSNTTNSLFVCLFVNWWRPHCRTTLDRSITDRMVLFAHCQNVWSNQVLEAEKTCSCLLLF